TSACFMYTERSILSQLHFWLIGRSLAGKSLTSICSLSMYPSCCKNTSCSSLYGKYILAIISLNFAVSTASLKPVLVTNSAYFSGSEALTFLATSMAYCMHHVAILLVYQLLFTLFSYSLGPVTPSMTYCCFSFDQLTRCAQKRAI